LAGIRLSFSAADDGDYARIPANEEKWCSASLIVPGAEADATERPAVLL
jgi:hypothetical protein